MNTARPVPLRLFPRGRLPTLLTVALLAAALALSFSNLGALLPASQWEQALRAPRDIQQIIVHDSWLPRLVVSWLCGAILGLAGTIFQQVLRNPLAEPMTLGVSAGAQLALTIATLAAPALAGAAGQWIALGGALAAAMLVFGLAWRSALAPVPVAVAGMVVTLYCGSIGVALQMFYAPYLRGLFIWGGGSLVQQDWSAAAMLAGRLAIGMAVTFLLLRPMILFGLADANAHSLGLSLRRMRLLALALAVMLSAAVVSAVGVIGFIGLAAPPLARMAGARRLGQRLVAAPLCGALILWVADQAVQRFSGVMGDLLPTGAATALYGAPVMLILLARMQRGASLGAASPEPLGAHSKRCTAAALRWRFAALTLALLAALALSLLLARGPQGWHVSGLVELSHVTIWRAPRAFAALAAGAMLAVAGTLMQRLTGNPLASPELLGVSAGAALGLIALVIGAAGMGGPGGASHVARLAATSFGALVALLAILAFSHRSRYAPERVMLAGVAIGALFQAVVAVAIASGGEQAAMLLQWLSGSTYTITPADAGFALALCVVLCALLPFTRRWLQILPLGDAPARALGVPMRGARLALLGLIALLTAAATLIVGPLSFAGLVAPHVARLFGARRASQQLALAAPVGALTMVLADWLGRTLLMPRELPAGLVATLIGAPYLMWLLGRRR
ncbi:Fe(3+)-hydroxamate ABC transporter permease FhuB [Burkholderia sp. Ax-1719]|uniref:Fe(3+)-hydroxamate ABC transporter permease FhuB n=1 Tax=Burkholderia sp. Ax-1719 TaxID=2608334 RepID=UPI00141E9400|nr:Fe(3+)-hydroxamate ABC transporter permease FhuB [Burkholderia sp. Ax-1719]NIE65871.1 Fe(3+)-hydroxamate ABC transporter permease FhuB [Burkholderia sp. Ax-1719]